MPSCVTTSLFNQLYLYLSDWQYSPYVNRNLCASFCIFFSEFFTFIYFRPFLTIYYLIAGRYMWRSSSPASSTRYLCSYFALTPVLQHCLMLILIFPCKSLPLSSHQPSNNNICTTCIIQDSLNILHIRFSELPRSSLWGSEAWCKKAVRIKIEDAGILTVLRAK
jgi:hypothetical protein